MSTITRFAGAFGALTMAALVACSDGSNPAERPAPVASVAIAPQSHALRPGESVTLQARLEDANGRVLTGRTITWQSGDEDVATVSGDGVVTAVAHGNVTVFAKSEGREGSATIDVLEPLVANVELNASAISISEVESYQLIATARAANGDALGGRAAVWTSSNESVATVSPSGFVQGVAPGTATITVTIEGKGANAALTITPGAVAFLTLNVEALTLSEGLSAMLVATPRAVNGRALTGRAVQWSSSDRTIAPVSAYGDVSALRGGQTTVTATVEGKSASAAVKVISDYLFDLVYDAFSTGPQRVLEMYALDLRDAANAPTRLLLAGTGTFDVVASPDGSRIAFAAADGGNTNIFVANRDGSNLVRLTNTTASEDHPTWSPDGSRIAFRRWQTLGMPHDIWVMNADGTGETNLTAEIAFDGEEHAPAWSPQVAGGSRIAFVHETRGQDGYVRAQIWSMKPDGTDKKVVTSRNIDSYDDQPAWSPDGGTIVFVRSGPVNGQDLLLVDAALGTERALFAVSPDGAQAAPAWSPDGQFIAFISRHEIDDDGTYEDQVYTVRPDGTRLVRRTYDVAEKRRATFATRTP